MDKLIEVLDKFNNGENRYNDCPFFKEAINSITRGLGIYAVLDNCLNALRTVNRLHDEKVQEIARLSEENKVLGAGFGIVASREYYPDELETLRARVKGLLVDRQLLTDETLSLNEALNYWKQQAQL